MSQAENNPSEPLEAGPQSELETSPETSPETVDSSAEQAESVHVQPADLPVADISAASEPPDAETVVPELGEPELSETEFAAESSVEAPAAAEETGETPPEPRPAAVSGRRRLGDVLVSAGNVLVIVAVVALIWVAWQRVPGLLEARRDGSASAAVPAPEQAADPAAAEPAEVETGGQGGGGEGLALALAPLPAGELPGSEGISRMTSLDTVIPRRARVDIVTYTVERGDTLFEIADQFGIEPETVLWGNFETLEDNPHMLSPGQTLNILPVDGTYYQWQESDTLNGVAGFFGVDVQAILEFPGNKVDLTVDPSQPGALDSGTWLVVPGGKRAIKDWGPPTISRESPAAARFYGEGYCGSISEGAYGTGTYIWPTTDRSISGYGYSGIHPAIDIAGQTGNPVYASDSGVVVFAGWSNFGYGNLIVIDHGGGWQTAYAHLDSVGVGCGQSVFQGGYIGALGNTGNSTGSHLHFEIVIGGAKPNPLDYLQ